MTKKKSRKDKYKPGNELGIKREIEMILLFLI
jgi:hypothetical protein